MQNNRCVFIENNIVFDENVFVQTGPDSLITNNMVAEGIDVNGILNNLLPQREGFHLRYTTWIVWARSAFGCNSL